MIDCDLPSDAHTCKLCSNREEMYLEADQQPRGLMYRLGCVCDESMDLEEDEDRTEWCRSVVDAVAEWNQMQTERLL